LDLTDLNSAQEEYNKMVAAGASQSELDAKFKDAALKSQLDSVSAQERLAATQTKLQEAFVALIEPLLPLVEVVTDLLTQILPPIMSALKPIIDVINLLVEVIINQLKPQLVAIGNVISNLFGGIGDQLSGLIKIFTGDFEEGFKQLGNGIYKVFVTPIQLVIDMMYGAINGIIATANKIPGVDIESLEIPNLTGAVPFANGGIVSRPTNALIGEAGAEAVIPLDKLMAEFREMRAILTQIANREGTVYLDGTKVGTAMAMSTYKTQ
jgi:hypothetical protein